MALPRDLFRTIITERGINCKLQLKPSLEGFVDSVQFHIGLVLISTSLGFITDNFYRYEHLWYVPMTFKTEQWSEQFHILKRIYLISN